MALCLYVISPVWIIATTHVFAGRGRKGLLRSKLRGARSYAEWKAAALTLDQYLGFDEWKKVCRWSLAKEITYSPSHRRMKVPSLIISS